MSFTNVGMRKLIQVVNNIQDAFSRFGGQGISLDLPQIAVVGGQSAGKSSVLENFVGRDFLPRGSGIVTRCPLILQLVNTKSEEYGQFLHCPTKRFTDFSEIRAEIERETDRKIGKNKNVSGDPINLRIYSPNVLDLTLIDLPGITRNPVGDQPRDIEDQIIKVILTYISRDNCLILAVSAANQDIATSDALKIASQVDPEGNRTIGVLTKLDLMDHGTDATEILKNKVLPLKRGYIGVVNRSQSDITSNKDIKAALQAESSFFLHHDGYKHMAHRLGTPYLQKTLNEQLTLHIKNCLPGLEKKLQQQIKDIRKQQEEWKIDFDNEITKTKVLFNVLKEFNKNFEVQIGLVVKGEVNLNTKKLTGGALINRIMNKQYKRSIQKVELNEDEMRSEISYAITNLRGVHIGLFTPDMAFDAVVKNQIERFEEPSNACIDNVVNELRKIVKICCEQIKIYPKLREVLEHLTNEHIEKIQQDIKNHINYRLQMECSYMNTDHEDFIGISEATQMVEGRSVGSVSSPEVQEKSDVAKPRVAAKPSKPYTNSSNSHFFEIVQEGWITLKGARCHWFVLTDEFLSWYKKNDKKEKISNIPIADETEMDFQGNTIVLSNLFAKSNSKLELVFQTENDFHVWLKAFESVGLKKTLSVAPSAQSVSPSSVVASKAAHSNGKGTLRTQIEIIRILIDSYLRIIKKTLQDFMPKLIMHGIINSTKDYLATDLHISLLSYNEDELLEVDPETAKLSQELNAKFNECKKALAIIRDFSNQVPENL